MLFIVGDYLAGMAVGVGTALAVRIVVAPGMDLVIATLLGMAVGVIVHVVVGMALTPLLGMFHTVMTASLIGFYGGMLFAMRGAMAAGSRTLGAAVIVRGIFGLVVVAVMKFYDLSLRRAVLESGED
jgi:hypothetical protein